MESSDSNDSSIEEEEQNEKCAVPPSHPYWRKNTNCGLSKYPEQCGEAIHSKFKPTHSRYKRMEEHPDHGKRLLSSVLSFNGRRIC